jgi:hypothetical protein
MDDPLFWLTTGGGLAVGLLGALCATVVPLVVIGALVVVLVRRGKQSSAARQEAQTWPSTTGTVLMSTIQVRRTGRSRSEIPVVVYQYQANGQMYQGNTIRAGDQFGTIRVMGQAQATVARYPAGSTVTVYYNPANPAQAALER